MSIGKILLTGKNGQVGWELQRALAALGEVITMDRHGMDIANPDSTRDVIREIKPALIVNAAAYTAVDKAESEPDLAIAINGIAPGILAEEAKRLGAAIVHYSTDYVFDGTKEGPYTEDDTPNPLNVYGKTKLAGERAIQAVGIPHIIFRTSWVYGARGKNFLLTMLRLAKERDEIKVVDDQIGAPTWSRMIAESTAQVLAQLYSPITVHSSPLAVHPSRFTFHVSPVTHHRSLFTSMNGIYHLTAGGSTSWHGFARAAIGAANRSQLTHNPLPKLIPITSDQYPGFAKRPRNSQLSNTKLAESFGLANTPWDLQLSLCMQELTT